MNIVHHLVECDEWEPSGDSTYSPPSLEVEGFIHFSATDQVSQTSLRHYGEADHLLLVTVAVKNLRSELRWEDLSGHGQFPHLYGPLNLDAVIDVRPYAAGENAQPRSARVDTPSPLS